MGRHRATDLGSSKLLTAVVVLLPKHGGKLAAALLLTNGRGAAAGEAARGRERRGVVLLALGEGAVCSDVAGVDAVLAVHEDKRGDDVEATKDDVEDASSKNQLPHGPANLLACSVGLGEFA